MARDHLLFVQFGDYGEAYDRLTQGGDETYRDQRRSVSFVADLVPEATVTVVAFCGTAYARELAPGLIARGLPQSPLTARGAAALLDEIQPSHVILRTPNLPLLRAAQARGLKILPSFADIFARGGPRGTWTNWQLGRALRRPSIICVANHSLNASRSVVTCLGVPADKVVPRDQTPMLPTAPPKTAVADPQRPRLFFAGALTKPKGLGDLLDAMEQLNIQGLQPQATIVGGGDVAPWQARADALGLGAQVQILGRVPNAEVRRQMAAHDIVVVPSRHDYAEGLPNTIPEGLASRSVVALSDHPAFAGRLTPGQDCLSFRASDPADMARVIAEICQDPDSYARLSAGAETAAGKLCFGMEWETLVTHFLNDPVNATGWVEAHSLVALGGWPPKQR